MPPMDYQTAILAIAILFISYAGFIVGFSRHVQLPPGPKGVPILGAALEHPKTEFWKTYADWGRKYGSWRQSDSLGALVTDCFVY